MNSERRHLNPQEKIAALKRHLLEGIPVSTICDELGIVWSKGTQLISRFAGL